MKISIERMSNEETEEISLDLLLSVNFETDNGSKIHVCFADNGKKIAVSGSRSRISVEPRAANVVWVEEIKEG